MHNSKYYLPDMQKNISQSGVCARMNHTWEHLNFQIGHESATGTELNKAVANVEKQKYIKQKAAAKEGDTLLLSSVETED